MALQLGSTATFGWLASLPWFSTSDAVPQVPESGGGGGGGLAPRLLLPPPLPPLSQANSSAQQAMMPARREKEIEIDMADPPESCSIDRSIIFLRGTRWLEYSLFDAAQSLNGKVGVVRRRSLHSTASSSFSTATRSGITARSPLTCTCMA